MTYSAIPSNLSILEKYARDHHYASYGQLIAATTPEWRAEYCKQERERAMEAAQKQVELLRERRERSEREAAERKRAGRRNPFANPACYA